MHFIGRYLFEKLVPGGVVNGVYFAISLALLLKAGVFPHWTQDFIQALFWPLIIGQFAQNIVFAFICLLGPKAPRTRLRIYGWLGLLVMLGNAYLIFQGDPDLPTVAGAALACGFFLELILRDIPEEDTPRIYKTILATGCIGFLCSLFMGVSLMAAYQHPEFDASRLFGRWGLFFFGFRILWDLHLGQWVEDVDNGKT